MEGSSSAHPFMRRESNKRSFSTMPSSHRDGTPDPFADFRDEHYDNGQTSRRRRLNNQLSLSPFRYAGDGLDFRRPVMSVSGSDQVNEEGGSARPVVIDLTDEDGAQGSQNSERQASLVPGRNRATAGSSRAPQRLPRFGRQLIDSLGFSDEEDSHDTSDLPGQRYVALPGARRPQSSSLRRPAPVPSPPPDMDDDDIEVLTSYSAPRRSRRTESHRTTPAAPLNHAPRSLTPHPNTINETIDLTQDDDDDVVHLDTRQREGVSHERPIPTANVGTRSIADRVGQLGNIASILRDEGVNFGGRLMQRLGGMAGLDQEIRASEQAFDHFHHNHGHRHYHNHHQHHHHHADGAAAAPMGNLGALRMRAAGDQFRAMNAPRIPLMNYGMTAFDINIEGGGNRPPTPKYSPPPEPPKGFTRSPAEDEVVVCPNCGDELAMGDSDMKQEVWAIKSCGHVYCGECAHNRARNKGKRGKSKAFLFDDGSLPAPFSKCVVDSCGAPAASKSMVLVYLGS